MGRRAVAFVVGFLLIVFFAVGAAVINLPYVVSLPGPTVNTLGSIRGQPLIQVAGHRTYHTDGHLDLVTAFYFSGPGLRINLFVALDGLLSPNDIVVPTDEEFLPGTTVQVEQQNAARTTYFRNVATAAALSQLKIPFGEAVRIAQVRKGMPAARVLRAGDVLTAVDGRPVRSEVTLFRLISGRSPGHPVTLTVDRGGVIRQFRLITVSNSEGRATLGIEVFDSYRFPFTVRMNADICKGAGCALMFALGLIDKLAPLNLTDGKFIAGAGTLDDAGNIGPVSGMSQFLADARSLGATIFLVPASDCRIAVRVAPTGLRLVKVSTLNGAVQALEALQTGGRAPACTG
jgi:PDZ domain-containing protein